MRRQLLLRGEEDESNTGAPPHRTTCLAPLHLPPPPLLTPPFVPPRALAHRTLPPLDLLYVEQHMETKSEKETFRRNLTRIWHGYECIHLVGGGRRHPKDAGGTCGEHSTRIAAGSRAQFHPRLCRRRWHPSGGTLCVAPHARRALCPARPG